MDLFLEKETYGILFFNANSFDILDCFIKDYADNYNHDDIEIIGSWKLFGIHDGMILIKAKNTSDGLTNFMGYCRDFADKKFELPSSIKTEDDNCQISELLNGNSSSKKYIEIIEFWVDPLIPFRVNTEELENSNFPFLISFLRIKDFNINKLIKLSESFDAKGLSKNIVGLFQGYGLYDIIAIIKCETYNDIQNKLNMLRSINNDEDHTLFFDTASIITIVDEISNDSENELTFSALLKIIPSNDTPTIWEEIRDTVEKIIYKSKVENINCKLLVSHRQGFFDMIITVETDYNNYINLINILNRLPFIEDVATIIRYNIK